MKAIAGARSKPTDRGIGGHDAERRPVSAQSFDDRGVGQAAALAHGEQPVTAAGALELVEQGWPSACRRRRRAGGRARWPPPLTLTLAMSGWSSRSQARTTEANASLISTRSMSSRVSLARSSTVRVAGIGPVSIVTGSTPARANAWNRARGVRPRLVARSSLMMSTAEAPSVICDELPAVIFPPSGLKAGFSLASTSSELSGRMPSSAVNSSSVSAPASSRTGTGTISFSNRPSAVAWAASRWRAHGELVELLTGDAPLVGDHLSPDALADQPAALLVALHHPGAEREPEVPHAPTSPSGCASCSRPRRPRPRRRRRP